MRRRGLTPRETLLADQAEGARLLREHPDEYHPDTRVAAAFADMKANESTIAWLEKQLRQIQARLDKEQTSMDLVHKGETQRLLQIALDERKDLEEVCQRWLPQQS